MHVDNCSMSGLILYLYSRENRNMLGKLSSLITYMPSVDGTFDRRIPFNFPKIIN